MSNLKLNSANLSERARKILEGPVFYKAELEQKFELQMDSSDKILTVFHHGERDNLSFLIEEVLCLFAKNRRLIELFKLNIREIENFLRDENHLPATDFKKEVLEETLKSSIISLVACGVRLKFAEHRPMLLATLENWSRCSLVEKNSWAQEVFSAFECQLVLSEGNEVILSDLPPGLDERALQGLLDELFKEAAKHLNMKVVAVQ